MKLFEDIQKSLCGFVGDELFSVVQDLSEQETLQAFLYTFSVSMVNVQMSHIYYFH